MERIIEKYKALYEECKKYPRIDLGTGKKVEITKDCVENGFIETFCMDEYEKNLLNNHRKQLVKSKSK